MGFSLYAVFHYKINFVDKLNSHLDFLFYFRVSFGNLCLASSLSVSFRLLDLLALFIIFFHYPGNVCWICKSLLFLILVSFVFFFLMIFNYRRINVFNLFRELHFGFIVFPLFFFVFSVFSFISFSYLFIFFFLLIWI